MEDLASGPILVGTKRHPFAMAITSPPSQAMARRGEASPHAPPQSDALGKAPTIQLHAAALFGPKKKKKIQRTPPLTSHLQLWTKLQTPR